LRSISADSGCFETGQSSWFRRLSFLIVSRLL
jgi:hypothetical protein